ncbi:MAG: hypothetical protein CM15mP58_18840 [Burkholderiaceae bacterium]|nr:MAG: hypothetical protein CM15mP58_18840 [Burkholderiaceae bacterium]
MILMNLFFFEYFSTDLKLKTLIPKNIFLNFKDRFQYYTYFLKKELYNNKCQSSVTAKINRE